MKYLIVILAAVSIVLGSCATGPTDAAAALPFGPLPASLAELVTPGPHSYDMVAGTLESEYGCTIVYELYSPRFAPGAGSGADRSQPLVVIAHGFMRDLERMRGWAEHFASYGVESVVLSFCNSTLVSGNHDRNADDLLAVAGHLAGAARPIIYVGYSAGGLSAMLAAEADERAIAYIGLDPVDSGDLAATISELPIPALYLYGEAARCNAENNMVAVMPPSPRRVALRVRFATHCDFESPTNRFCERLCGEVVPEAAEEAVRNTILSTATSWAIGYAEDEAERPLSADDRQALIRGGRAVELPDTE